MNPRIALYYSAASALLIACSLIARPYTLALLYPALSALLLALAYLGPGHRIYAKHNGRLPLHVRLLLAPVRLGQYLSWRQYARRSSAWDEIAPHLLLGRALTEDEARRAIAAQQIAVVIDLTAEFSAPPAFRDNPQIDYLNLPTLDLTAPAPNDIDRACEAITRARAAGRTCYIHCKAGYSRSAAVVAVYLHRSRLADTPEDAIAQLRQRRPGLILRPEALAIIRSED